MNLNFPRFRPRGRQDRFPLRLGRSRIYLLPTRYGIFFFLARAAMLLGSVNHNNNFAFLMTFLLAGVALIGLLACHRNLAGLCVESIFAEPVFAGQTAVFTVSFSDPKADRRALWAGFSGHPPTAVSLRSGALNRIGVSMPAERRGLLKPPPLRLSTVYPLGMFRAWATVFPDAALPVFPKPTVSAGMPAPGSGDGPGEKPPRKEGAEDFEGMRRYRPGDTMGRIAWKALSRGRGLLVKEFSSPAGAAVYIDYDRAPGRDVEEKLSFLCDMVLRADRRGAEYGLRIPGVHLPPGAGPAHRLECLKALALFKPGKTGP